MLDLDYFLNLFVFVFVLFVFVFVLQAWMMKVACPSIRDGGILTGNYLPGSNLKYHLMVIQLSYDDGSS